MYCMYVFIYVSIFICSLVATGQILTNDTDSPSDINYVTSVIMSSKNIIYVVGLVS